MPECQRSGWWWCPVAPIAASFLDTKRGERKRMEENWQARARAWRARRTTFVDERRWSVFSDFKAGITGRKGERAVTAELQRLGLPALHDVILEDEVGTTQIDHLVLGRQSIVVIETKTYAGTITGEIRDREWTQHLGSGKQRFPMLNPHVAKSSALPSGRGAVAIASAAH